MAKRKVLNRTFTLPATLPSNSQTLGHTIKSCIFQNADLVAVIYICFEKPKDTDSAFEIDARQSLEFTVDDLRNVNFDEFWVWSSVANSKLKTLFIPKTPDEIKIAEVK